MQSPGPARFDSELGEAVQSCQRLLETARNHRVRSSGQRAVTPGITINRKPMEECSATGSTRLMPKITKAIATAIPARPYTVNAVTNSSANCTLDLLPVNRDRSPRDLCAGARREV